MAKYTIHASWLVSAQFEVEADSLDEAKAKADAEPLPSTPEYVDGSFTVDGYQVDGGEYLTEVK